MDALTPSIAAATALHKWIFIGYFLVLLMAARLTALLWISGNRLQDAIRADALARIKSAEQGIESARRDYATANERAEKLELEAGRQRERAARAEHELVELRQRIVPRRLSVEQRTVIVETARQSVATLGVVRLGDAEAKVFATDLITSLQEAGWHVAVFEVGVMSPPTYGLIYSGPTAPIPPEIVALLTALRKVGLNVATVAGARPQLIVGLKPIPP